MEPDIVEQARKRAISYRECGPSAEHTAAMLDELASHVERLRTELVSKTEELAAMRQQRDEARRWLRDACAEIARIETRFYDALTPQQIAERNGWDCFAQQEGGGA